MDMIKEQKRLKDLVETEFMEKATGHIWVVTSVSHNIYKDVVLHIADNYGHKQELIEGSEDYYKKYMRLGQCTPQ